MVSKVRRMVAFDEILLGQNTCWPAVSLQAHKDSIDATLIVCLLTVETVSPLVPGGAAVAKSCSVKDRRPGGEDLSCKDQDSNSQQKKTRWSAQRRGEVQEVGGGGEGRGGT